MDAGYDKPLVRLPLSYQGWPEPRQMQLDPSQLAFTGMRKDNGITEQIYYQPFRYQILLALCRFWRNWDHIKQWPS
jgi:hypothetical protein